MAAVNNKIEIIKGSGTSEDVFLVLSIEEAADLEKLGYLAHVLDAKSGGLAAWNKARGIGDGDGGQLIEIFSGVDAVALLMPKYVFMEDKSQAFVETLGKTLLAATNTKLFVPELAVGQSVRQFISNHGEDTFDMSIGAVDGGDEPIISGENASSVGPQRNKYIELLQSGDGMAPTAALAMLEDHFTFAFDREKNMGVATPHSSTDIVKVSYDIEGTDVMNWLRDTFNQKTGMVIPLNSEVGSIKTMGSRVARSRIYIDTKKRVIKEGGNVWIDLANDSSECIKLNAEGWETFQQLPEGLGSSFIRDSSVLHIQTPAKVDFKDARSTLNQYLRPYVNSSEEDWTLLIAWLVNHVIDNESPILMFLAEAGLGKSTACRALQFAGEGGFELGELSKMPSKPDDLIVTLAGSRITTFDNISKISHEMSDTWCQSTTGVKYSKRKLRTDNEVVTLKTRSRIIANAISTNELRDDVKERLVTVKLTNDIVNQMKTDDLNSFLVENHPAVYGALLALAVRVLELQESAPVFPSKGREGLRMQAYARVLWSIDQLWGTSGIAHYKNELNLSAESAYDDPLTLSLMGAMAKYGSYVPEDNRWVGRLSNTAILNQHASSTFHERLNGSKEEALTPRALSGVLTRKAAEWKRLGIQIGAGYREYDPMSMRKATFYEVTISGDEITDEIRLLQIRLAEEPTGIPQSTF